ncbi:MAG: DNA alkylation repair protein [Candidatus Omnitrophica bacterium]|nr:DNA alkylation repair protein [Candidatus Omnitrophota bacterium]
MTAILATTALHGYASPEKAQILRSFFKTGPGQYGEGDIFIGVTVPHTRLTAKAFSTLPLTEARKLLHSPVHEERLLALLILIMQYKNSDLHDQEKIISLYLDNTARINNWDLVDLSAPKLLGEHLVDRSRKILGRLARSTMLWERRIAIVSTLAFIRRGQLAETFNLADKLLTDREDLIHKATGWMLREAGKRNQHALEDYLRPRYQKMPRTMLRYAIERFAERKRQEYLK